MKIYYILALVLAVLNSNAHADDLVSDKAMAEVHRSKARIMIEQKDWPGALEEIDYAIKNDATSSDSWLIKGTVAMRLEKDAAAMEAFKKYLEFNPPADKAQAVRGRMAELEIRLDRQKKAEEETIRVAEKAKAQRFGPEGSGLYLIYSPVYQPKIASASDLDAVLSNPYGMGFRIKMLDIAIRAAKGTVARVTAKDSSGVLLRTESLGKLSVYEFFMNINLPLNEPAEGKAGFQFLIPIHLGMYMNTATFVKQYWNMGFTLGSGVQVRYYTGAHLAFDVTGLYSTAFPITGLQNNDLKIESVYNASGEQAKGSLAGPELMVGLTILF